MLREPVASARDISRLLGEVEPLIIARILALGPSVDELDEAIRETEDEGGFGEEPRTPSSPRVASVRAVLAELVRDDLDAATEELR